MSDSTGEEVLHVVDLVTRGDGEEDTSSAQGDQLVLELDVRGREFEPVGAIFADDAAVQRVVEIDHDGLQPRGDGRWKGHQPQRLRREHARRIREGHPGDPGRSKIERSIAELAADRGERDQPHAGQGGGQLTQVVVQGRRIRVRARTLGQENWRFAATSETGEPVVQERGEIGRRQAVAVTIEVEPDQLDVHDSVRGHDERIVGTHRRGRRPDTR